MYELFLTSIIPASEHTRATAVLQGLCAMNGWQSLHRVLYFTGPQKPRAPIITQEKRQSGYGRAWGELQSHLSRQSFTVQARYEVFEEQDFGGGQGEGAGENGDERRAYDFNTTPAMLRWMDIPDPNANRPVTQRKKIEIADQRGLQTFFQENQHRFKAEVIEQSYTYYRDNIEYTLVRHFPLPSEVGVDNNSHPVQHLPRFEDLKPLDSAGKWMLFVRTHVLEENSPDKVQKAQDQLMAVREELMGVFDFKVFDRRAHDTRITQMASNMPAPLPQTARA